MSVLTATKGYLKHWCPGLYRRVTGLRQQRRFRKRHGGSDYRATQALVRRYGKQVIAGPFAGMRYGDNASGSAYVPKLLGTYEEELHPVIESIIREVQPKNVIDVGCAEGYYAVGLARRIPAAKVYAYDIDAEAREHCADLARLNGVSDRIEVRGLCDHAALRELAGPQTFVLCDCEGFELTLLDLDAVPALARCTLLVELHDFILPGTTPALLDRFAGTHDSTLIDTAPRDLESNPALQLVPAADRERAVAEGRPGPMQWVYWRPKSV